MGSPNEGKLQGGEALVERPYLRFLPNHHQRWGTPQLVGLLDRGAERLSKRHKGSVVEIGDLSQRGGGDIAGHHSHESGRDADVGFLATDANGRPVRLGRLVAFDEDGRGPGKLRFDDARNWALVEAWLTAPHTHVAQIFIAAHLRDRLLTYARTHGALPSVRQRAALALLQPRRGLIHDNHFHVRVACPPGQHGTCIEFATRENRRDRVAASKRKAAARKGHTVNAAHRTLPAPGAPHAPAHGPTALSHVAPVAVAAPRMSRPVVARARKRIGTTGGVAPSLVSVVPAPNDF